MSFNYIIYHIVQTILEKDVSLALKINLYLHRNARNRFTFYISKMKIQVISNQSENTPMGYPVYKHEHFITVQVLYYL